MEERTKKRGILLFRRMMEAMHWQAGQCLSATEMLSFGWLRRQVLGQV